MLSKLSSAPSLFRNFRTGVLSLAAQGVKPNMISKRWSGHNNMDISPSRYDQKFVNNWIHFYFILGAIPVLVITTIANIRANPELSEVPEGYEPRQWEYYKSPLTRWMARYLIAPMEYDHEMFMHMYQDVSEKAIMDKITTRCEKVMKFHNDHRTMFFYPAYGEYVRGGRDEAHFKFTHSNADIGEFIDKAYDPETRIIPPEGFLNGPPEE